MGAFLFAEAQQQPGAFGASQLLLIALIIGALAGIVVLFVFFSFVQLWIQCLLTGARIGILDMIRMKLCKVDYAMVVRQKIALVQAGVKVSTQEMEAHYLSPATYSA
jgi:uncharacterized protein YqfA (UPF0365 family)